MLAIFFKVYVFCWCSRRYNEQIAYANNSLIYRTKPKKKIDQTKKELKIKKANHHQYHHHDNHHHQTRRLAWYKHTMRFKNTLQISEDTIRTRGNKYKLIQHHCYYDLSNLISQIE